MQIIRKDTMPNGVKIQLEDWGKAGLAIGAYPVAMNSGKYGWVLQHRTFRLHIHEDASAGYTNLDVTADYERLVSGEKKIEDLSAHFWNGEKDKWFLGMFPPGTDEWWNASRRYGINATF